MDQFNYYLDMLKKHCDKVMEIKETGKSLGDVLYENLTKNMIKHIMITVMSIAMIYPHLSMRHLIIVYLTICINNFIIIVLNLEFSTCKSISLIIYYTNKLVNVLL